MMRRAEARREVLIISINSIRLSFTLGGHVGWTMNRSLPRMSSLMSITISPSAKRPICLLLHFLTTTLQEPSSVPSSFTISSARGRFALPLNTLRLLLTASTHQRHAGRRKLCLMAAVSAGYVMSIPTSTPYRLRVDRLEGLVADERGERKASGSLRVTSSRAQKIQQEQHPGSQTGLRWKPSSSWKRPISRRFWQHAGMHFWQQQTWWEGLVTIWWSVAERPN